MISPDFDSTAASFGCELRHLGSCGGPLQMHHIISRGMLRNIVGGRDYCEKEYPEVFLALVCAYHNSVSRIADTKSARAFLISRRLALFGRDYVSGALDGLRAATKTGMPEWKLEALLESGKR